MMKTVWVLGASILQVPMIQTAKKMGYRVAVIDANPAASGIPYADEFFLCSTVDEAGVLELARRHRPDGITTIASDMPVRTIARVATALGIPGPTEDLALRCTDKALMREALQGAGVPQPTFYVIENEQDLDSLRDELPLILKPVDSSGSRGVMTVSVPEDLPKAFDYARKQGRSGRVIAENLMYGPEVSVETFTVNGQTQVIAMTDKRTDGVPHFVELAHRQPSQLPEAVQEDMRQVAIQAVTAMGILNGPAHVELIGTQSGAKVVELGHRLGGDFITSHLVPLSTGVNLMGAVLQMACGDPVDLSGGPVQSSIVRFLTASPGRIAAIEGWERVSQRPDIQLMALHSVGDILPEVTDSSDRVAAVIAAAESYKEALRKIEEAISQIEIKVVSS